VCNLSYTTMGSSNYMCYMQLKISCIQQLQNDSFFLVMMNNVKARLMEGLDISWGGKFTRGGYKIMKEQAYQKAIKSIIILKIGGKVFKWRNWWLFKWGTSRTWWLQDNGLESQEEVPRPIAKIKTY
jgi:hypothetical protein